MIDSLILQKNFPSEFFWSKFVSRIFCFQWFKITLPFFSMVRPALQKTGQPKETKSDKNVPLYSVNS